MIYDDYVFVPLVDHVAIDSVTRQCSSTIV